MLSSLIFLLHLHLFLHATASPLEVRTTPPATPKLVNITTIAANAQNESTLECWQLTAPFVASADAGVSGAVFAQLGETAKTSYGIIPAGFDGGLHNAPAVQWVVFLAGKAVITLPNSPQKATVQGGRQGLILAVDTKEVSAVGHTTRYPSKKTTIAMQIPLANNEVPPHTVLHGGPCSNKEQKI